MKRIRIAVVGDVHEEWDAVLDRKALESLDVDLTLFVGDFGEQNVKLVQAISELPLPKAVILGNHDAWLPHGPKRANPDDGVQRQLDLLGDCHVGYRRLDFPELELSVVGARPFSSGGPDWESNAAFAKKRYGYKSFRESAQAIAKQALAAPSHHMLIIMGHNGPTGLGTDPSDICGKDFGRPDGGDWGDPDLQSALELVRAAGRNVALVIFGHMHHNTRKARRRMLVTNSSTRTIYLNTAVVPRTKQVELSYLNGSADCRNFTVVELEGRKVQSIQEVWVNSEADRDQACIASRKEMLHP